MILLYPLRNVPMTKPLSAYSHPSINLRRARTASRLHLLCDPMAPDRYARIPHGAIHFHWPSMHHIRRYARVPHRAVHFCHHRTDGRLVVALTLVAAGSTNGREESGVRSTESRITVACARLHGGDSR